MRCFNLQGIGLVVSVVIICGAAATELAAGRARVGTLRTGIQQVPGGHRGRRISK
jgi:hypothetical protein